MKKSILIFLMLCVAFVTVRAQSTQIAVLNHNGTLKTYYGFDALIKAHDAADAGDVITLSSGGFTGTEITKAITLQGAGMAADTARKTIPTTIGDKLSFNVTDTTGHSLHFEGIFVSQDEVKVSCLKNAQFVKCRFNQLVAENDSSSVMQNIRFIHARIATKLALPDTSSMTALNSVIMNINCSNYDNTPLTLQNSVVQFFKYNLIENASIYNCILLPQNCILSYSTTTLFGEYLTSTGSNLKSSVTSYNSIGIYYYNNNHINTSYITYCQVHYENSKKVSSYDFSSNDSKPFRNTTNSTNTEINLKNASYSTYFKTFNGTYTDDEDFALANDSIRNLYTGTDGTEIGLYGGNLPYDATPSTPQIVKFKVAPKSTSDGKLNVEIEVQSGN